jgi:hypothetical protein
LRVAEHADRADAEGRADDAVADRPVREAGDADAVAAVERLGGSTRLTPASATAAASLTPIAPVAWGRTRSRR